MANSVSVLGVECVPYACPEPVLVNSQCVHRSDVGQKGPFSVPLLVQVVNQRVQKRVIRHSVYKKNGACFEFFLCLSRACLRKMIITLLYENGQQLRFVLPDISTGAVIT